MRKVHAMMLVAALSGGCMTAQKADPAPKGHFGVTGTVKAVPNAIGPWGEPVPVRAGAKPPVVAKDQKKASGDVVAAVAKSDANSDSGIQQTVSYGAKTGAMPMPTGVPGAVAATGALVGIQMNPYGLGRTSVRFAGPAGMKVAWYTGMGGFGPTMVEAPGRYNFPQGGAFRLKLSDFPNRAGLELYPTLEVIPASSKTATFLAHSAVPVNITEEDLEQVTGGNFVIKVIYLPDPAYQDLTTAGPDEIVSSRLEPGVDPIAEAMRRGSILLIFRLGNIDMEAPNSPGIDQPAGSPFMNGPKPKPFPPGALPNGAMPLPDGGPLPDGAAPNGMNPNGPIFNGGAPNGAIPNNALPGDGPKNGAPIGNTPNGLPPGAIPIGPPRPADSNGNTAPAPVNLPNNNVKPAGRFTASVEAGTYRIR